MHPVFLVVPFQPMDRELLVVFILQFLFAGLLTFFKTMVFNGELEIGNNVHMEALWFVFSKFIQSELDTVRAHSNNYCLRKSTFAAVAA